MGRAIGAGILAGVAGAVACGLVLTVVSDPTAAGIVTPMTLISRALGTGSRPAAWLAVFGAGALLGAVFGVIAGARGSDAGRIASIGFFYLLGVWLVLTFAAVPLLLGIGPTDIVRNRDLWPWLPGMMVAAIAYAGILTAAFTVLRDHRPAVTDVERERDRDLRRAA